VPTADAKILSNGTAYITDVGMCGPQESVIGLEVETVLKRFLYAIPQKFNVAKGLCQFNAVEVSIDEKNGKSIGIKQVLFNNIKI